MMRSTRPRSRLCAAAGDCNVSLTGARRPQAENEVRLLQSAHVGALRQRTSLDDPAAGSDLRLSVGLSGLFPGVTDEAVEVAGPYSLPARDAGIQLFQDAAGDLARTLGAIENNDVAVSVGVDAEAILDQSEVRS